MLEHFLALLKASFPKETELLTLLDKIPLTKPKSQTSSKCDQQELEKVYVAPRTRLRRYWQDLG